MAGRRDHGATANVRRARAGRRKKRPSTRSRPVPHDARRQASTSNARRVLEASSQPRWQQTLTCSAERRASRSKIATPEAVVGRARPQECRGAYGEPARRSRAVPVLRDRAPAGRVRRSTPVEGAQRASTAPQFGILVEYGDTRSASDDIKIKAECKPAPPAADAGRPARRAGEPARSSASKAIQPRPRADRRTRSTSSRRWARRPSTRTCSSRSTSR